MGKFKIDKDLLKKWREQNERNGRAVVGEMEPLDIPETVDWPTTPRIWQGRYSSPTSNGPYLEEQMEKAKRSKNRLTRVVHWRHNGGNWVVVSGPFPQGFIRSETRDSPEKASKLLIDSVWSRPETTRGDQYAKVHRGDIIELEGGENEFGPVSP